ncbi:hypothetical protein PoB_005322100 [Plakobranchus ocellatus]|uniref:Uncharacterized protein n=1 Tax=Plakobranchus ocellatus TaxID=259542 RepID=A0AAV4C5U3_9GAST|nr:hypothetical protein PoB_005322100 [Plakobranchus ocellatus]
MGTSVATFNRDFAILRMSPGFLRQIQTTKHLNDRLRCTQFEIDADKKEMGRPEFLRFRLAQSTKPAVRPQKSQV